MGEFHFKRQHANCKAYMDGICAQFPEENIPYFVSALYSSGYQDNGQGNSCSLKTIISKDKVWKSGGCISLKNTSIRHVRIKEFNTNCDKSTTFWMKGNYTFWKSFFLTFPGKSQRAYQRSRGNQPWKAKSVTTFLSATQIFLSPPYILSVACF